MKKQTKKLIKASIYIINLVVLAVIVYLYISQIIVVEVFTALLFLQFLACGFALGLYLFVYKRLQSLARELDFSYIKGSFPHLKFEGMYKGNWWQLHFTSKETGDQWGIPLTYVKLQYKKPKEFDEAKLMKYDNHPLKDSKIISIRHIKRDYKNYLLLKRRWFTFDKKKIYELMGMLLTVAEKTEIKHKK